MRDSRMQLLLQKFPPLSTCIYRLCKKIPAKFQESLSKCSAVHPKIALWRKFSASHSRSLAGMFYTTLYVCLSASAQLPNSLFAVRPFVLLPSLSLSYDSEIQSSQKRAKGLNADPSRSIYGSSSDRSPPISSPPIRKRGGGVRHGKDLYQRQPRIHSNNVA